MTLGIFSTDFREVLKISNSVKIRPVAGELFHADGRTDRQEKSIKVFYLKKKKEKIKNKEREKEKKTKLTAAFSNFANALGNDKGT